MNVALIILIIVILVLVLYLVYYVGFSAQTLIDLNKSNPVITTDNITNPTSTSFTYGMWVYVNNWSSGVKEIVKAQLPNNGATKVRVYLDSDSPTLKTDIYTTDNSAPTKTVTITNNFPIQRWVYIVISVEGSVVDCYLDGKLVKSQQLQFLPNMSGDYTIGYGSFNAYLTKFYRIASPSDPQTVWNNYMAGNGFNANAGPAYGFSFVVTKDQAPIAQYQYQ
jgi:hypothetical protein